MKLRVVNTFYLPINGRESTVNFCVSAKKLKWVAASFTIFGVHKSIFDGHSTHISGSHHCGISRNSCSLYHWHFAKRSLVPSYMLMWTTSKCCGDALQNDNCPMNFLKRTQWNSIQIWIEIFDNRWIR